MNTVFPFLRKINTRNRRDLEYFLKIPSNPSSDEENKIAIFIIEHARNGKPCTDEVIVNQFFNCKKAWYKVKHRIQETFLRYFTMQKLETHPIRAILLAEIYDECGQENKKHSAIKKQKKKLEKMVDPNKTLYEYLYEEMGQKEYRDQRKKISDLNVVEQKLDEFYLERKLAYLIEKRNRKDIINNPSLVFEDSGFINWAAKKVVDIDAIKTNIYHKLYILLTSKSADNFDQVKEIEQMIEENYEKIDQTNLEKYYGNLLNFYIKELNQGRDKYANLYLACLSKVLDLKIIFPNNQLTVKDLKNAIGMSLITNNIANAWNLIEQHQDKHFYAEEEEGKNFITLMQAIILLNEDKYTASSKKMLNYKLNDLNDDIESQLLGLQLEYSLKMNTSILRNVQALRNRLRRNRKLPVQKKKAHLMFLGALRQLVKKEELDLEALNGKISILKQRWLEKMVGKE